MHHNISIRQSIGPSVCQFIGLSVTPWISAWISANWSREESHLSSNIVIIQSFHHHEDASLALWVLFSQISGWACSVSALRWAIKKCTTENMVAQLNRNSWQFWDLNWIRFLFFQTCYSLIMACLWFSIFIIHSRPGAADWSLLKSNIETKTVKSFHSLKLQNEFFIFLFISNWN